MDVVEFVESIRKVEFVSDLHLSLTLPKTVARWERYLTETDADALVILGDLFEVWVGDDCLTESFESRCASHLAEFGRSRPLYVMVGNRDFLLGQQFLHETKGRGLADPSILRAFGQSVLCTHGDAWCTDDVSYQEFRKVVRQPKWQQAFLNTPLPSRLEQARLMREASRNHQSGSNYMTDITLMTAQEFLGQVGVATLIHGHTHQPCDQEIGIGQWRHVLSDWNLDGALPRAEVLQWTCQGMKRQRLTA